MDTLRGWIGVGSFMVLVVGCGQASKVDAVRASGDCIARPGDGQGGVVYLLVPQQGIVAITEDGVTSWVAGSREVLTDPNAGFLGTGSEAFVHGLDGSMYVQTFGGVARLASAELELVAALVDRRLGEFAVAGDGTIWASTWQEEGRPRLDRWDGEAWSPAVEAGARGPAEATDVAVDGSGTVWAVDGSGLWRQTSTSWERVEGANVENLANSGDGRAFGWSHTTVYALDAAGVTTIHDGLTIPGTSPLRTSSHGTTTYTAFGRSRVTWATRDGQRCSVGAQTSIRAVDDSGRIYAIEDGTLIVADLSGEVLSRIMLDGLGVEFDSQGSIGVTGSGPRLPRTTQTEEEWRAQREAAHRAKLAKAGDPNHLVMGELRFSQYPSRPSPAEPSNDQLRDRYAANLDTIAGCIRADSALLARHREYQLLRSNLRVYRAYWPEGGDAHLMVVGRLPESEDSVLGRCVADAMGLTHAEGLDEAQRGEFLDLRFGDFDIEFRFE